MQLGGTLSQATTVAQGSNNLSFTGTGNPTARLDVRGTARVRSLTATGTRMVAADVNGNLGNVGINTTFASAKLDIQGGADETGSTTSGPWPFSGVAEATATGYARATTPT